MRYNATKSFRLGIDKIRFIKEAGAAVAEEGA
jgi:hypothetical protein